MYNKGDLKKLADELRSKGAKVKTEGAVYCFYAKDSKKAIRLKQRTTGRFNKITRFFIFATDFYNDWFWSPISYVDWDNIKKQIFSYCL